MVLQEPDLNINSTVELGRWSQFNMERTELELCNQPRFTSLYHRTFHVSEHNVRVFCFQRPYMPIFTHAH